MLASAANSSVGLHAVFVPQCQHFAPHRRLPQLWLLLLAAACIFCSQSLENSNTLQLLHSSSPSKVRPNKARVASSQSLHLQPTQSATSYGSRVLFPHQDHHRAAHTCFSHPSRTLAPSPVRERRLLHLLHRRCPHLCGFRELNYNNKEVKITPAPPFQSVA